MTAVRAICRAGMAAVFLLGWTLGHAVVWPFLAGSPRARARWRANYLGGACRNLLRVMGVRVHTEGSVPTEPCILVTNHLGYLDVLVLASLVDASFVSRADVRDWPVFGPLTRMSGTIFIDRDRRSMIPTVVARMQRELARGFAVVFFPEGTSGRGDVVMPFRASLFAAPVQAAAPVRCAALHYRTPEGAPPADEVVCWWGDMRFAGHLWKLLGLPWVQARVRFAPEPIVGRDRKDTATRAQAEVEAVFEPVVVGAAS